MPEHIRPQFEKLGRYIFCPIYRTVKKFLEPPNGRCHTNRDPNEQYTVRPSFGGLIIVQFEDKTKDGQPLTCKKF